MTERYKRRLLGDSWTAVLIYARCSLLIIMIAFSCLIAVGGMALVDACTRWAGVHEFSYVCTFCAVFTTGLHMILMVVAIPAETANVLAGR